jgi:hypothetical protein
VINAVGVYGRLTAAHPTAHAATMAATEQQASTVGALDRRIGQIDMAIKEAAKPGRPGGATPAPSRDADDLEGRPGGIALIATKLSQKPRRKLALAP